MFDLHQIIISLSYLGIFILMTINGAFNFPSSQILYLIVGYFVAIGNIELVPAVISGSLGNALGNMFIYELVYKYGKPVATKFLYVKEHTIDKFHKEFEGKGLWFLYLGKLTPSIKVFIPAVAGLSKIKRSHAIYLFTITSAIWATIIIYIGYFFGEQITLENYTITISIVGIVILILAYIKFQKIK